MAEIHNFSDLRAIRLLEAQLLDIRNELRQIPGYDPTETLAENVRTVIHAGQLAAKWLSRVQLELAYLKKEQENDKMAARTYPIAGPAGFANEICPTVTACFTDYHPSRESVSERLLGSTDGYGR